MSEQTCRSSRKIKCVLVGDGTVGKTYLIETFMTNKFPTEYYNLSFDVHKITVNINGVLYPLSFFDTPGQEDYDKLRHISYPETDVFLICYSVVSPYSYINVKEKWIPEILHHSPKTPILLVGLKIDLRDDPTEVERLAKNKLKPLTLKEGKQFAKKLKAIKYVECSSLSREGMKNVIDEAVLAALCPYKPSKQLISYIL